MKKVANLMPTGISQFTELRRLLPGSSTEVAATVGIIEAVSVKVAVESTI
jgi:hypothetical protein